jgi:hypothetical protein
VTGRPADPIEPCVHCGRLGNGSINYCAGCRAVVCDACDQMAPFGVHAIAAHLRPVPSLTERG